MKLLVITHTHVWQSIFANLILYCRITSSQGIKKQGGFWGTFLAKENATYEAGNCD
jgi:hypothetical protein